MTDEQFSAVTGMLNLCRRTERKRRLDLKEWQRLRDRMNKAFLTPGPPRIKADYGLISDLMRGVPVKKVAERYKVSRGTVYRMVKDHPELAKLWEAKQKQPDPAPSPATGTVPVPAPVVPTKPPLPDVLLQFLATHRPDLASISSSAWVQRMALRFVLSRLGVVRREEFNSLADEELVARVMAHLSAEVQQAGGKAADHADDAAGTHPDAQAILGKFLARHRPEMAANRNLPAVLRRRAVVVAMVEIGLGSGDELKLLTDGELATRIVESGGRGQAIDST